MNPFRLLFPEGTSTDRWEHLARGLLWLAALFGVFTFFELFLDNGVDVRGAIVTAIPALLCVLASRYAAYRRDR